MKGIELPINILVVVAIAVIVLLGLVALYFVGFSPFSATTAQESAKNTGCRTFMHQDPVCNDPSDSGVNVTYPSGVIRSLQNFTVTYYGCASLNDYDCARRVCGCPGY